MKKRMCHLLCVTAKALAARGRKGGIRFKKKKGIIKATSCVSPI